MAINDQASEDSHEGNSVLTVGDRLRAQRESKGYSLNEMASLIRLRPRQIQALEDGDYESLPGQAFVVGFLKSYATALGLDVTEIVTVYRREEAGHLGAPQLAFPQPTSEGRRPGTNILIGSCLAAIVAVGSWYFYVNENKIKLEFVPDLPHQLAEKIPEMTLGKSAEGEADSLADQDKPQIVAEAKPVTVQEEGVSPNPDVLQTNEANAPANELTESISTPDNKEDLNAPEQVAVVAELRKELPKDEVISMPLTSDAPEIENEAPKPSETESSVQAAQAVVTANDPILSLEKIEDAKVNSDVVQLEILTKPDAFPQEKLVQTNVAIAQDAEEIQPEALGVHNTDARIVLLAQQDVWVQVIAAGNEIVLDRILGAGDTFMVPDLAELRLNTANAAGVEIRLDGEILGFVGTYGGIVRDLDLSPNALKQRFPAVQ